MSKQPSKSNKQAGQSSSHNRKETVPQIILTARPNNKTTGKPQNHDKDK